VTASRRATLAVALGFLALEPRAPELQLLHRCFDSWRGIGDVVIGMARQGFQVSLGDHGAGQWIAVFYAGPRWAAAARSGRNGAGVDAVGGDTADGAGGVDEDRGG